VHWLSQTQMSNYRESCYQDEEHDQEEEDIRHCQTNYKYNCIKFFIEWEKLKQREDRSQSSNAIKEFHPFKPG